jgi:single-strand DNA-binding protein
MAYDNTTTIAGNLTRDPELRYTNTGTPVTEFGLAWNSKDRDGKESVSFFDVTCWRDLAEHVAESLSKGNRVVVYGRLDQNTWETKDGDKRSKVRVMADDVSVSLRFSTATIDQKKDAPPIKRPEKTYPDEEPF